MDNQVSSLIQSVGPNKRNLNVYVQPNSSLSLVMQCWVPDFCHMRFKGGSLTMCKLEPGHPVTFRWLFQVDKWNGVVQGSKGLLLKLQLKSLTKCHAPWCCKVCFLFIIRWSPKCWSQHLAEGWAPFFSKCHGATPLCTLLGWNYSVMCGACLCQEGCLHPLF